MTSRRLLRQHLRPSSDDFSADSSDKEYLNKQLDLTDRLTAKLKIAPSVFRPKVILPPKR